MPFFDVFLRVGAASGALRVEAKNTFESVPFIFVLGSQVYGRLHKSALAFIWVVASWIVASLAKLALLRCAVGKEASCTQSSSIAAMTVVPHSRAISTFKQILLTEVALVPCALQEASCAQSSSTPVMSVLPHTRAISTFKQNFVTEIALVLFLRALRPAAVVAQSSSIAVMTVVPHTRAISTFKQISLTEIALVPSALQTYKTMNFFNCLW